MYVRTYVSTEIWYRKHTFALAGPRSTKQHCPVCLQSVEVANSLVDPRSAPARSKVCTSSLSIVELAWPVNQLIKWNINQST